MLRIFPFRKNRIALRLRTHGNAACRYATAMGLTAVLAASGSQAIAQSDRFVPYDEFIRATKSTKAIDLLNQADTRAKDPAEIERMRATILDRYKAVKAVKHSFFAENAYYDCVDIMEQPAVARYGLKEIATPPPPTEAEVNAAASSGVEAELLFDRFGNAQTCNKGEVPLERISLENMARFGSVEEFQRNPGGPLPAGLAEALAQKTVSSATPQTDAKTVESAATTASPIEVDAGMFQQVNNLGGSSILNVWQPAINTSAGQTLSAFEELYVGGKGGTDVELVEAGWAVQPSRYGNAAPHLFIFATPDNFKDGCVNNSCGDFVLTGENLLGGNFVSVSSKNGHQQELTLTYQFSGGNWWLIVGTTKIGYYPGSLFKGLQLDKNAQYIAYEAAGVGTTSWPQEGSGGLPNGSTAGTAAYQREISYFDTTGKQQVPALKPLTSLPAGAVFPGQVFNPPTSCYNTSGPFLGKFTGPTDTNEVFFFAGGPGGSGCNK